MSVVKHPQPPPPLQVTPKRFVYFVVYNERKACISSFPEVCVRDSVKDVINFLTTL